MTEAKKDDNTLPAGKNWVARTMRPHANDGQFDDGDDGYGGNNGGYYAAAASTYNYGPDASSGYYDHSQHYSYPPTTPPLASAQSPEMRGHYYYPPKHHATTPMPMPPLSHAGPHHHEYRTEPEYERSADEQARYVHPPQMHDNREQPSGGAPPRIPEESPAEQHQDVAGTAEGKEVPDNEVTDKDVLSGRGGGTNNHSGNRYFRQLVEENRGEYVVSKKWQKREIARTIVMTIRSKGGRFLKKETGRWFDTGDQKAREKTSQALREGLAQKMRQALRASGSINSAFSSPSPRSVSGHVHQRMHHSDDNYSSDPYQQCPPYKRQRVIYESYGSHDSHDSHDSHAY